jgi:hypothetical protein
VKHFIHFSNGIAAIQGIIVPVGTVIHYHVANQIRKSAVERNAMVPKGSIFSEENVRDRDPRDRLIDSPEGLEMSTMVFESSVWGALLGSFLLGMAQSTGSVYERLR